MDLWKNSLATGGCCCWLSGSNGCWEWRPLGMAAPGNGGPKPTKRSAVAQIRWLDGRLEMVLGNALPHVQPCTGWTKVYKPVYWSKAQIRASFHRSVLQI